MPNSVVHRTSDGKPPEDFVAVMSRICRQCGRYVEGGHLKCCRGCRAARYCSSKCQRAAWKAHATACMSTKVCSLCADVHYVCITCAAHKHSASTLICAAASGACLRTPTWRLFTSSIAIYCMHDTVMLTYRVLQERQDEKALAVQTDQAVWVYYSFAADLRGGQQARAGGTTAITWRVGDREPAAGSEVPCPQSPLAASHAYGEGNSEEKKPRIQAFCRRVESQQSPYRQTTVCVKQLLDPGALECVCD